MSLALRHIDWVRPILTDNHTQAQRSPEEEGDFMAFEQLVAEATIKKEKEKEREERKKKHKHHPHPESPTGEPAASA